MTGWTPESVAEATRHAPIVPPSGGVPPWCVCGWEPHSQFTLADHLREMRDAAQEMGLDIVVEGVPS